MNLTRWNLENNNVCCNDNFIEAFNIVTENVSSVFNESNSIFIHQSKGEFNLKSNEKLQFQELTYRIIGGIICGLVLLFTLIGMYMLYMSGKNSHTLHFNHNASMHNPQTF